MRLFCRTIVVLAAALLLDIGQARSAPAGAAAKESAAERDARMNWWRQCRFGMFIHWGLYAIPGGVWRGKEIPSAGEWIMNNANIPVAEYEQLAKQFDPVKYDPDEWARIARDAGVRYIVITSKHHDGFCLFKTSATRYNAADATPYGKDLLVPLARACRKQGLHFCVYYSIMDWHHPAQYRGSARHYNPTRIHPEKKAEYMDYMKTELKELIAEVKPEVLWFDGEWPRWYTEPDGREMYAYVRQLDPSIIINNRVGKARNGMEGLNKGGQEAAGDFGTPEQRIPATGLPGIDWETCMTMNDTWGFKKHDHHWKSVQTLVRNIIDTASKGGNYLLNVGPTAEGQIPEASVERLREIGHWMNINGEAIYGTQASALGAVAWGRCTQRAMPGWQRLYLHLFDWPQNGELSLPSVRGRVLRAYFLDGGQAAPFDSGDGGVRLRLPKAPLDPIATVVVLDLVGNAAKE